MAKQPWWGGSDIQAQAWNFCWLGDGLLPGIVEVTCSKGREIDKQKSKGTDGCFLKDEGYEGADVTITLRLSSQEQWEAWQELLPRLDPEQVGGLKQPHEIRHPEPNSKGINMVYVRSISGDPPTSKSGKIEVLECMQWFPSPKPKVTSMRPKKVAPFRSPILDAGFLRLTEPDIFANTF